MYRTMLWCLALALALLGPAASFAAWCPHCLMSYGEAAPGDEARVFALRSQHEMECAANRSSRGATSTGSSRKGVVTLWNATPSSVRYTIVRSRSSGSETIHLRPGYYQYHYEPEPCRFDVSFSGGRYTLDHAVVGAPSPGYRDGRDYTFVTRAGRLDLVPGRQSAAPATAAPARRSLTERAGAALNRASASDPFGRSAVRSRAVVPRVSTAGVASITGSGSGTADAAFPAATSAQGRIKVYVRQRGRSLVVRDGKFRAARSGRTGSKYAPYRSQVWIVEFSGLGAGTSVATVTVRGTAGTVRGVAVAAPGGGTLRMTCQLQFNGGGVTLTGVRAE